LQETSKKRSTAGLGDKKHPRIHYLSAVSTIRTINTAQATGQELEFSGGGRERKVELEKRRKRIPSQHLERAEDAVHAAQVTTGRYTRSGFHAWKPLPENLNGKKRMKPELG